MKDEKTRERKRNMSTQTRRENYKRRKEKYDYCHWFFLEDSKTDGGREGQRDLCEINECEKKSLCSEIASLFSLPVNETFPEQHNMSL